MAVDPGTAMLIATAIASAAKGAGDYFSSETSKKSGKRKAKETRRETAANLLNDSLQGRAEMEAQRLGGTSKLTKRKSQSMQDTSDLVREAFNI